MENAQHQVILPTFAPAAWSPEIDLFLLPALDRDVAMLGTIKARCLAGFAQLLGVFEDEKLIACVVLSTDGDEGVIVAAGGRWKGGGLVEGLLPVIEAGFKTAGMKSCRVETFRRGLMNKIIKTGYRPSFVAWRKTL